ncbi:hypothetical protein BH09PLA1_BH09PLA1_13520 [soil metagenome]
MGRKRAADLLILLAALGIAARILLAVASIGSYDALLWRGFAEQISGQGLLQLYRTNPHFNHPPIPGWWAASALAIANATPLRFEFIFKLPMIASDAIVCVLLWKILVKRASKLFAGAVCAAYAWNLSAILTSAYHCNTDSIYAMLALLAVYLVEERRAHFLGGLALAAAINVKLIPVVLIIPMVGGYRDWKSLLRFIAGLSIGVIPFLLPLLESGKGFAHNTLAYTPNPAFWGVNYFLRELVRIPRFSGWASPIMERFHDVGRYIVLLAIALFTLVLRRWGQSGTRIDRYTTCAAGAAIFLILAPGFGMQYTVLPIPLLMAAAPFFGLLYGTIAGVGCVFSYWLSWSGTFPLASTLGTPDDGAPDVQIGLLAWATLIAFVVNVLARSRPSRDRDEPALFAGGTGTASASGVLIALAILGLLAREVLAWYSLGSADAGIFRYFSDSLRAHGLFWLYEHEAGFNHPPLPGYWAACAGAIAQWLDSHAAARWPWFSFVFKQPVIAADAIVCALLYRIWLKRSTGPLKASLAAAAFAWCPIAILLSAYHGNTDPVYAMLCLVAAYAIQQRRSFFLAGLALGAAINVKFIPVLFVPVLAALCRDWRQLARFTAGLAIMSIPFWPLLIWQRGALARNVIGYGSTIDYWGVQQFFMESARMPRFSAVAQTLAYSYHNLGRWIVLASIALLILFARRQRWDSQRAYSITACAAAIFLILTPGFGLQYLALATPLLFAVGLAPAVVFGIFAGLFALLNYWLNWAGGLPLDSTGIATPPRAPGAQFGLIAWAALVAFVWKRIRQGNDEV